MASISAVIVAGGKGERMLSDIRKQYLVLDDIPILSRTLLAFAEIPSIDSVYLAVPENDFDFCKRTILPPVNDKLSVQLVKGGMSRQESVYNCLSAIVDPGAIVVIHDGVRPFLPVIPTKQAIEQAMQEGGCILGIPAVDTLKLADRKNRIIKTMQRSGVWQAQTPQIFQFQLIKKAHDAALLSGFAGTDDASLVENLGESVKIIYGSPFNIKITQPEDLIIARGILKHIQKNIL